MPNDIHIRPAETARDRRAIITFPWRIYRVVGLPDVVGQGFAGFGWRIFYTKLSLIFRKFHMQKQQKPTLP